VYLECTCTRLQYVCAHTFLHIRTLLHCLRPFFLNRTKRHIYAFGALTSPNRRGRCPWIFVYTRDTLRSIFFFYFYFNVKQRDLSALFERSAIINASLLINSSMQLVIFKDWIKRDFCWFFSSLLIMNRLVSIDDYIGDRYVFQRPFSRQSIHATFRV